MQPTTDQLMLLPDASRWLAARGIDFTYTRLWRRVASGVLPATKLGQRYIIRLRDLEEFAQRLEQEQQG